MPKLVLGLQKEVVHRRISCMKGQNNMLEQILGVKLQHNIIKNSFPRIVVDIIAGKKISCDCRIKLRSNNLIRFTTGSDISHLYYENNTPERFRFKSSRSQMIFKIGVLKNFTKLRGQKCVGVSF